MPLDRKGTGKTVGPSDGSSGSVESSGDVDGTRGSLSDDSPVTQTASVSFAVTAFDDESDDSSTRSTDSGALSRFHTAGVQGSEPRRPHQTQVQTRQLCSAFSNSGCSSSSAPPQSHTKISSTVSSGRKAFRRLQSLLFFRVNLAFDDDFFESTYMHHCDQRNSKLFRTLVWPVLSSTSFLLMLNYLLQCPWRCHNVCGADQEAMLHSNGLFIGKGSWQCAEREGVATISVMLSAFLLMQFWLAGLRLGLAGFERLFLVVSIPFSIFPYFFSIHRASIIFGTDPKQYGWFGVQDDDSVPLLINLGVLCLGTSYFKLRTSHIWWIAPIQVLMYFVWTICFRFGIHHSNVLTVVIICIIYSSLSLLILKGRYNSEVWERNAWSAVRHHRHLIHQYCEKDEMLAARQETELLSADYNAQARRVCALHGQLYMQFLAASQSETADKANAIWSAADTHVEEIHTEVIKLAALDTQLLRAVLKEHKADAQAWSYIQRMDEAWISKRVRHSSQKKTQPRHQIPKHVLGEDGSFVQLTDQSETWRFSNTESLRYGSINATWFRSIIFNELHCLMDTINSAATIYDIELQYPRINSTLFPDELIDANYVLLPDPKAEVNGPLANMKYGPMKTIESCLRKVQEYRLRREEEPDEKWEQPDGRYVLDQLRLTISTANPMVAAIVVEALFDITFFRVVSLKNKYLGPLEDVIKTGSPSILIAVEARHDVLPPLIFEIQVYVDAFLSLKNSQHKTYEFSRAEASDLLYPIVYDKKYHYEVVQETARSVGERGSFPNLCTSSSLTSSMSSTIFASRQRGSCQPLTSASGRWEIPMDIGAFLNSEASKSRDSTASSRNSSLPVSAHSSFSPSTIPAGAAGKVKLSSQMLVASTSSQRQDSIIPGSPSCSSR